MESDKKQKPKDNEAHTRPEPAERLQYRPNPAPVKYPVIDYTTAAGDVH